MSPGLTQARAAFLQKMAVHMVFLLEIAFGV
jgi:hypothetical protein